MSEQVASKEQKGAAAVVANGNTLYFFKCNGIGVGKGTGGCVWVALPGNIELAQKVAALFSDYKRESKG